MRTFTFIAIATVSMWIAADANAQQNDTETDIKPVPEQLEDNPAGEGQRGKGRRGNRGRRGAQQGKGMQQGQGRRRGQGEGRGSAQMMEMLFTRLDADKSGSISLDEAPDRLKDRFAKLDSNGDESVSKDEFQASFANRGEGAKGKEGAGKGRRGGKGKEGAGKGRRGGKGKDGAGKGNQQRRGQMMDPAAMIERSDANNDGSISLDEAPERLKQRFDRLDADSSGTITADELKSAFEKMKQGGMRGKGGKGGQVGRNKSADENATKPVKPSRPPMDDEGA
ncbi:EF-hand domain-containing protein [Mariniblastus fucicola]|uniref:EF hand n=1 Tax=Mariniblastus fucicola TaxID=980251 RepID=A0A5B9PGP4_9BACT|nr:EF-hand domain-containing protein [Mariniblastus fucicola]QEG24430.1 EF hand [Mariniblastus fucicola]